MEAIEGSGWVDLQAEAGASWDGMSSDPSRRLVDSMGDRLERMGGVGSIDLLEEGGVACVARRGFHVHECIKSEDEVCCWLSNFRHRICHVQSIL